MIWPRNVTTTLITPLIDSCETSSESKTTAVAMTLSFL